MPRLTSNSSTLVSLPSTGTTLRAPGHVMQLWGVLIISDIWKKSPLSL
jgi:hypothetical protein